MRKATILAAFPVVFGAAAAMAQSTPNQPPQGQHQQGHGGWERGRGPGGPGGFGRMLLKGITLSDAQKAQLKALHKSDSPAMAATHEQNRAVFDQIRTARAKGDTATARRLMREERGKTEAQREKQVAALRSILTTDQRPQFDKNVAELKQRQAQAPGRGMRPDRSGQRPSGSPGGTR